MTLTFQQIYQRYSVRDFARKVEVKRLLENGSYESDWQDIEELSGLKLLDNSVGGISFTMSNNSYNFGIVTVGNVKLTLNSKNGQFDDETNSNSIWFDGYIRHGSLIRIRDGYVDKYTDISSPVEVLVNIFEGFIDATSPATRVDDMNLLQDLQCVDVLNFLLKKYTIADMGVLSSTTFDDLVYEVMNRSEFTTFFTVSALNISPGYNATSFDISQYEGQTQIFTLFENISIGHSFFYVKDGVFYYKSITSGNANTLTIDEKRTIVFSSYKSGSDVVFERFYWENDNSVSYVAPAIKYNRSQTINIKGVTNATQRQNLLDAIGTIAKTQRQQFQLKIPFYADIKLLDTIIVYVSESSLSDAFIWGVSRWGQAKWRKVIGADNIEQGATWLVREINHNDLVTTLILEQTL